jgi:hypothetical protein
MNDSGFCAILRSTDPGNELDRRALVSALQWTTQEFVEEHMIVEMGIIADEPLRSCFVKIANGETLANLIADILGSWYKTVSVKHDATFAESTIDAEPNEGLAAIGTVFLVNWKTLQSSRAGLLRILRLPRNATSLDVYQAWGTET